MNEIAKIRKTFQIATFRMYKKTKRSSFPTHK